MTVHVISTLKPNVVLEGGDVQFEELWDVYVARSLMNAKRSTYYDGEAPLKDFGIALPPQMQGVEWALGWNRKGVHAVTDRSVFEGFVDGAAGEDPFELGETILANQFVREFAAARVSSAVHGCSFISVTKGDVKSGEPAEMIMAVEAGQAGALWDRRMRELRAFLSVGPIDGQGRVRWATVHTPRRIYNITLKADGTHAVEWRTNPAGRVTVTPLVYGYELRRPLGHSRISRASMGFADSALRTIALSEMTSQFYSSPETFLFGEGVEKFIGKERWTAIIGRIKALDTQSNDSVDKPDIHRFTGASPAPHVEQLRMWANLFADDQDMEVKFADVANPSSEGAIFAAKETLITTTRDANVSWKHAAVMVMRDVLTLRGKLPVDFSNLRAQFTDPAIVSPSARADAFSKLATNIPGFGESEVGMEFAGLTREQIDRFIGAKKREGQTSRIAELVAVAKSLRGGTAEAPAAEAS